MKVKLKKLNKDSPIPEHKTQGAAAVDLYSTKKAILNPGETAMIPLGIAIEIPKGYFGLLAARSSTYKFGIIPANGVGIIDSDYNGNTDELKFLVRNYTNTKVTIEKATRIAQLLLIKCEHLDFQEVTDLGNSDRGGFGTTGHK